MSLRGGPYGSSSSAVAVPGWTAEDFNRLLTHFFEEGVVQGVGGALAVTQRGAGANMSIDVASGLALIQFTTTLLASNTTMKSWLYNDATVNLAVPTADLTHPRKDRVVAKFDVSVDPNSVASNIVSIELIQGTPAGSPSAPAEPSNSITLAIIDVPASDTAITTGQITDSRPFVTFSTSVLTDVARSIATDAALAALRNDTPMWLGAVSGTNTLTGTPSPAPSAYAAGQRFVFIAANANTASVTLNVNSLGAKTIKKYAGAALAAGDIAGSGHVCECVYDGTDVLLLNPAISIPASSIGKQTIFIPASAMAPRLTDGATVLILESAGNKVNRQALVFPPSAAKYAQFGVAMPKSWNAGTVTARLLWEHPSTVTNFGVVWGIQGLSLADDDAFDNAFGSAVTVTDTGGTPADHYKSPETGAVTLSNSPAKGDTAIFQIYRDATAGADNLAVDAYLYGVELYLTTDAANDA